MTTKRQTLRLRLRRMMGGHSAERAGSADGYQAGYSAGFRYALDGGRVPAVDDADAAGTIPALALFRRRVVAEHAPPPPALRPAE